MNDKTTGVEVDSMDKVSHQKFDTTTFGPGTKNPFNLTGLIVPKEYPLIYKKMAQILSTINAVGKDQKNQQQGFNFRGIDDVVNATHAALKDAGVFITTTLMDKKSENREVTRSNGKAGVDRIVELTMRYTFFAEDGSYVSSDIPSEGLDTGDKATNKALSAALKYALLQTFQITTKDMEDADRTSPELVPTRGKDKNVDKTPEQPKQEAGPVKTANEDGVSPTPTTEVKKIAPFRGVKAKTVSQLETPKDKPAPEVC